MSLATLTSGLRGRLSGAVYVLVAALLICASPTAGQVLDEATVLERARRHAPSARLAVLRAERVAAEVEGSGLWSNPTVSYQRQQTFAPQAESQDTVLLRFPFSLGGRRDAERGLAQTRSRRAETQAAGARSDAAAVALAAFYAALAAERRLSVERTWMLGLGEAHRVLEAREAAGEVSGYERARMELELELARSRVEEAEVELAARRLELASVIGFERPEALPALRGGFDVSDPAPLSTLLAEAVDQRVELEGVVVTEQEARSARRAADLAWVPDFWLAAGYQNLTEGAVGHGFNVQLTVALPVFDRGQGLLARANAELRSAQERRELLYLVVRAEVARSRLTLVGMRRERERFVGRAAGPSTLLERAARRGFEEGERTLVELIDAQRATAEVARRRVTLDLAVRVADVALRRATGALR